MGYQIGIDSPEMKFDNNTVTSMLLGGWLIPTVMAVLLFFVIKTLNKVKNENASKAGTDAQKAARPF